MLRATPPWEPEPAWAPWRPVAVAESEPARERKPVRARAAPQQGQLADRAQERASALDRDQPRPAEAAPEAQPVKAASPDSPSRQEVMAGQASASTMEAPAAVAGSAWTCSVLRSKC